MLVKKMLLLVIGVMAVGIMCYFIRYSCVNYKPRLVHDVRIQTTEMLERMSLRGDPDISLKKLCLVAQSHGRPAVPMTIERFLEGNETSFLPNGMPKIFHSTWKTNNLEEGWKVADGICKEINRGFLFCHWTDDDLLWFVASQYPEMLEKFLLYPYPVQRADVGRYLLLLKIGGFYRDVNLGCNTPLDVIITFENSRHHRRDGYFSSADVPFKVLLSQGSPIGVAGDFMAAVPGHPFFGHVAESLKWQAFPSGLPYVDVMLGTGPLFLGGAYISFVNNLSIRNDLKDELRIVPNDFRYEKYVYFLNDNTWHCIDGIVLWAIFRHGGFAIASIIVFGLVAFGYCLRGLFQKNCLFNRKVKYLKRVAFNLWSRK